MKISIKAARVNAELKLTEAATSLGVATSTLSEYENSKVSPRGDVIAKMSELYGIPVENLKISTE